jgi:hypothetical protein
LPQCPRHGLLVGSGSAAGGSLAAATSLSFAGFLFPLLKSMLGMNGNPAIR